MSRTEERRKLQDLTENQVVQTTKENDLQFRELLHKEGFKWSNGQSYIECDVFGSYDTTCYNVTEGTFYSRKSYEGVKKEILQASDFLTKKIKKSELLERIEVLEKKVADFEGSFKKTLLSCPLGYGDKGCVVDFDTEESHSTITVIEVEIPQFEVGEVYTGSHNMFVYCTKVMNGKIYGFGIDAAGDWQENSYQPDNHWVVSGKATKEDWKEVVLKLAYNRGYHKMVKDFIRFEFQSNHNVLVIVTGTTDNQCYIPIMSKGRWLFKHTLEWCNEK